MKYTCFVYIFCLLLLGSCGNERPVTNLPADDPFVNCKAGKPTAIFQGDFEQVSQQSFEIQKMEGIEKVHFTNGLQLELIQSGCNTVTQLFQFDIKDLPAEPIDWKLLAAEQFAYISQTSEQHLALGMWANAIKESAPNMKLGEKLTLQPGFSILVDKVKTGESTLLMVTLSQE